MHRRLIEIVTSLGSPQVAVVGDLMLDVYLFGQAERISPEAPVPVLEIRRTEQRPGGAAAVAMDLAALGARPICIGAIGKDQSGQALLELLQRAGINTDGIIPCHDRPTTTKTRLVGLAQHRHQQQLFRMDHEACHQVPDDLTGQITGYVQDIIDQTQIICLQDYGKGLLHDQLCQQIIGLARRRGRPVLVDPCKQANWQDRYRHATCVIPNRYELSTTIGLPIRHVSDCSPAAMQLIGQMDLDAVVIKLDKDGAYLQVCDGQGQHIPTNARQVYDVTGAGDQVLATLAVSLAGGAGWLDAVRLANIAAGIEVSKFGVASVTIQEILQDLIHDMGQVHRLASEKIMALEPLLKELSWRRQLGAKVVFTNGCFDILHRGHVEYLSFCKQQGSLLVVGLNSDSSVRQIKGPDRPVHSQQDRAALLAAMESVDYVTIFDEPTPYALIDAIRPDVLVKGQDWADRPIVGAELVGSYGGRVVLAPLVDGLSTTATIQRIRSGLSAISRSYEPIP